MKRDKAKYLQAKPDVDAVIKKHGFDAVRYILAKRSEQIRLERQLDSEKKKLSNRIAEIEKKLAHA